MFARLNVKALLDDRVRVDQVSTIAFFFGPASVIGIAAG